MFMESLKETLNEDYNESVTENGAVGYRTTGKELLDINFSVSSMRNMNEDEIIEKFKRAFNEHRPLAIKWLFYARDAREGLGERRLFRICIKYLAENHTVLLVNLIKLIPEYGRYDDLFCILDTGSAWMVMRLIEEQLNDDMKNMKEGKHISLLAKWLPSANASSKNTKRLARIIIDNLKISERKYRKMLSSLRSYLNVVEVSMSSGRWSEIDYSTVPSRANLVYNSAFLRNDAERRREYLEKVTNGESKINAGVLFPHDIVSKYRIRDGYDIGLEELWKAIPDFVSGNGNTICVADGSGSMSCPVGGNVTAINVANAMAIYFSEKFTGEFKNKYITFSSRPRIVDFSEASSLREKLEIAESYNEVSNTNIEAVFDLILHTAISKHMSQNDMPDNILILSDMEFDSCVYGITPNDGVYYGRNIVHYGWNEARPNKKLFEVFEERYNEYGYKLPRLVFWNINGRSGTIPVRENELGVALVSGFSPTIAKMVLSNKTDPFECLLEQLNSERYDAIAEALGIK